MHREAQIRSNRFNDSVLTVRCDRRTLVVLAEFFHAEGDPVTSLSSLVRMALEELKDILVINEKIEDVLSSEDATVTMTRLGMGNLNPSGRGERIYMKALQLEKHGFDPFISGRLNTEQIKGKSADEFVTIAKDLSESDIQQVRQQIERDAKPIDMSRVPEELIAEEEGDE